VQVRVHADVYDDACRALAAECALNPGGFTDQGKSFKDDERAEYDAIKRRFDSGDMTAYREAKDVFLSALVERKPLERSVRARSIATSVDDASRCVVGLPTPIFERRRSGEHCAHPRGNIAQ
jgi:hypothetical protein